MISDDIGEKYFQNNLKKENFILTDVIQVNCYGQQLVVILKQILFATKKRCLKTKKPVTRIANRIVLNAKILYIHIYIYIEI